MNVAREITAIKKQAGGWYHKNFHAWYHPFFAAGYGATTVAASRLPVFSRWGIHLFASNLTDWFWSKGELKKMRDWILRNNKTNTRHLDSLIRQWKKDWRAFQKYFLWFEQHDWKKLTDEKLAEKYEQLYDSYVWCNSIPYLADAFLSAGEEDVVSQRLGEFLISKVPPTELADSIQRLTQPVYDSFVNRSHKSLLGLAFMIERQPKLKRYLLREGVIKTLKLIPQYPQIQKALDRYAREFHWIHNNYFAVYRLEHKYALKEIRRMLRSKNDIAAELGKETRMHKRNKVDKRRLFVRLRLPRELCNLIHLSEKITRWQDDRKSAVYQVNAIMFPMMKEVARRTGFDWEDVAMTTKEELLDALRERKLEAKSLQSRRLRATTIHAQGAVVILTRDSAKKLQISDFQSELKGVKEFKGIPASPGKARGLVRITRSTADIRSLKTGEILVANNTTPDYVPAMRKAAAIVTEQGGITGHASIVSRELGKPCVVGVEGITRALRDGQRIEVLADSGTIRILKQ
ncbi:MAG: PEP-utilizing enzyme [bacterium]|nr:PEP-utilizing enzyme [bacterium]